ncbi:TPA: TetR/AcrR family transcriptional regulator [Citrobacter farmeri]|uniref:TetR/AcrR family transcriptional regulator n=5 Tax=Enterobacteriaceae TaxID=543 RepID=A0A8I0MJC6_CITAM|nr:MULTISPECIES: TetR/AcrR family transcriptional regulator [Enterobacteriaceae]EAA8713022.1 TetR/AcrR family transcriptional regulator [Salmonella enterica subsp. enterica serovar Derby]ECQ2770857.1 TetR/AcrR family transcriptional regulator [Salmonella enterica]EDW7940928.1 TetR/AcrR family transcriptional regulator [Salmonella enterica subsp. enterica serovar Ruiru]EHK0947956.1 TetR/AcrR family transcriptional regulator [Citrobacter farmeri]ELM2199987.1 TetR/AcrR family transcriptional regu
MTKKAKQARRPTQVRGTERFGHILDMAAGIIAEKGLDHLTMQNIAVTAKTTIGSLYHFFPSKEAVIHALIEQHEQNLQDILVNLEERFNIDNIQNKDVSVFIGMLFSPYSDYLLSRRDYLPLLQFQGFKFMESKLLEFIKKTLRKRYPNLDEKQLIIEADFIHAIATGILQQATQRDDKMAFHFVPKILIVLTAYLKTIEVNYNC